MKKILCVFSSLLLAASPMVVRADVGSCTEQITKSDEVSNGFLQYQSASLVSSETYQGMNYHLIFLNAGVKEVELVIKENSSVCENLLYNPTSELVHYKTIMPAPVAKKLEVKLREYSQQLAQKQQERDEALVRELRRKNRNK